MTCKEFVDFLWRYLDGELPDEERAVFDSHLAVCPACVRYLDTYRETVRLSRDTALDPGQAPEELVLAILDTCGRET